MLLLVTIGLVLVGAVSLVIGFVSNSLPPIYLSIACSVIAGIVLVVFSRMSKRQEAGGPSSSGFTPAPSGGTWSPPPAPPRPPSPPPVPRYEPPTAPVPARGTEAAAPASAAPAAASAVAVEDFPIEGYETLRVSQILPALEELDLDELDLVREREEQGKNRTTVLRRIDALIDDLESEDGGPAAAPVTQVTQLSVTGQEGDHEGEDELLEDEGLEDEDLYASPVGQAPDGATATPAAAPPADDSFPIPDYDRLPVAQILPLLDDLDDDQLDMVAEREEQGKNRAAILDRIDDMFEPVEAEGAAPAPAPPPPPPAKKVAVKKAPAAKVAAKKAAPADKAAPAAKRGPAKKAPAKTAGAGKRPAVRSAAVKKAALVEQPSPVVAPPARKAAPAKKAAKKR